MSSNNDPVVIPMIESNPSDLPGMDSSDRNTLTGEAVLSFHNISYRETVQSGFAFRKKSFMIERLSNMKYVNKLKRLVYCTFLQQRLSLLSVSCVCMSVYMYVYVC